ncbi:MAG TPA: thioredoxin family protein [Rhizomicrobium sp.]|jgi:predicted dithiol-disulfide oxidoreductase (DUF899 family)|nr:thioredoxin family protein [Rhizomicrobium sp.]
MTDHKVVSERDWVAERKKLLEREKELTHLQEQVAAERRALPWVRVDKAYTFDTPEGKKTLSDLFDGRSQLVVYHFMYGPEMKTGCVGCSFLSDHVDGANQHLKHHDVTYVAVSRGSLATLEAYKKRMGWKFPWVSSAGSDFNYDYHVSFTKDEIAKGEAEYNFEKTKVTMEDLHGTSVFIKDEDGNIYHTYSAYARGDERGLGAYMYLDLTPKGRNETGAMSWVKRHDEYGDAK